MINDYGIFEVAGVALILALLVGRMGSKKASAFFKPRTSKVKKALPAAIIWLGYPKLTSSLAADLSRDVIHKLAPKHGLDTVSQIAIDDDWSALRFRRVEFIKRPKE